jgi:hypothetical protein
MSRWLGGPASLPALALSLLIWLFPTLLCPAQAQLPSAHDVVSTVGFVAFTEGRSSDIIIQRNGKRIEAVIGTALQTGDEVTVSGNDAAISLKIHGQPAAIVLPRDGRSKTIGRAPSGGAPAATLASFIPESIRRLFTSEKIAAFQTLPRDVEPDRKILQANPFLPPGRYTLSPDMREVALTWRGDATVVELLDAANAVRASATVIGTSSLQPVPKELQDALHAVRVRGANNQMLRWDIEIAPRPAPPMSIARLAGSGSNETKFVHALWLMGLSPVSPPAAETWRLQGFTELAGLGAEMFAARQVVEAIRRGEIQR